MARAGLAALPLALLVTVLAGFARGAGDDQSGPREPQVVGAKGLIVRHQGEVRAIALVAARYPRLSAPGAAADRLRARAELVLLDHHARLARARDRGALPVTGGGAAKRFVHVLTFNAPETRRILAALRVRERSPLAAMQSLDTRVALHESIRSDGRTVASAAATVHDEAPFTTFDQDLPEFSSNCSILYDEREAIRCQDAHITGGSLRGLTELRGADLSRTKIVDVDARGVDLRSVKLPGAQLEAVRLGGANLSGADLAGAALRSVNIRDANIEALKLDGQTTLSDVDLRGARGTPSLGGSPSFLNVTCPTGVVVSSLQTCEGQFLAPEPPPPPPPWTPVTGRYIGFAPSNQNPSAPNTVTIGRIEQDGESILAVTGWRVVGNVYRFPPAPITHDGGAWHFSASSEQGGFEAQGKFSNPGCMEGRATLPIKGGEPLRGRFSLANLEAGNSCRPSRSGKAPRGG